MKPFTQKHKLAWLWRVDSPFSVIRWVKIVSHGLSINWGFVSKRGVWWQGKGEVHLLFMWFLHFWHLCQCCNQRADIEGQGVAVQQSRFTAGLLSLAPVLLTFSVHEHCVCRPQPSKMIRRHLFSRTWTSLTYCGSRTSISEPGAKCLTSTTVRKSMSCRGSWSCRKRRGCICSESRKRPCWHSYSSTRKRESTYPAPCPAPRCRRLSHLFRLHRYVHVAIIHHVRGRPLPSLLIGCSYWCN